MKKSLLLVCTVIFAVSCKQNSTTQMYKWPNVKAPVAEVKPHTRSMHNDTVVDNYYWMIDYFAKGPDSTKAVDYLKAENAYTDTMMSGTKQLQADLFTEMKSRIKRKTNRYRYLKTVIFITPVLMTAKNIINTAARKAA